MYGYLEEECPWQSEQSGQRPQGGSFPAMLKGIGKVLENSLWTKPSPPTVFVNKVIDTQLCLLFTHYLWFHGVTAPEWNSWNRNIKAFKSLLTVYCLKNLQKKFADPFSRGQCWSEKITKSYVFFFVSKGIKHFIYSPFFFMDVPS